MNAVPHNHELRHEAKRATPALIAVPLLILAMWGAGVMVIHSAIDGWDLRQNQWLVDHRTCLLYTSPSPRDS